jgi:Uma2 family endonuclease
MTALLEVPQIRERFSPISVTEYHQLGEFDENGRRTELIRGIILENRPKSPLHYAMIERLRKILSGQIQPGWVLRQEGPLTLKDSEPEPDLAIVRGTEDEFFAAHPGTAELAIEVAVTSLEIDRIKAEIYAEAGVKEYWIVCPLEKRVEVHRQPRGEAYAEVQAISAPGVLECISVRGVKIDLPALFA